VSDQPEQPDGPVAEGLPDHTGEVVVVTGMTGAGRSTAAKELEDLGYYVVDNLPPSLLRQVVGLVDKKTLLEMVQPYLPAAAAKKKQNFENRRTLDPEAKCYLPGIPRANYMPYPFQIVQSPRGILFVYEYATANRMVNMGKPQEAGSDTWMGTNNGHWEGDTLVVDVTGLNGLAWFDRAGDFASSKLHVVERFTRSSPYHLTYEATIEDPSVFSRPWKISLPLYKRMEKNAQLLEFKCVEFAEELLYGQFKKQPAK
jgi:hypothetical protein